MHFEMIGPINLESIGGGIYILCFMVKASRISKVYIFKNNSVSNNVFKAFHTWDESTTGILVKYVHSDNAKEYIVLGKFLKV